jgi:hypothetical protein
MSKKIYKINSEGDMEEAVRVFIALAQSKKKRKTISFWFPNEQFSDIFLRAAYTDFSMKNIPPQPNMNINIYIQGSDTDVDLEDA